MPRLLFPWLYVMDDRARTLELAFDRALRSKNWAQGTNFYSRWSPSESVPALFFNTTSANYGTPIVISQLYMADPEKEALAAGLQASVSSFAGNDKRKNAAQLLIEGIGANEYTRPAYFNILQYRPDLQLPLSTAATLSARFPYVTPPGVLYGDMEHKAIDTTLRETKSLQLIDGGFWDNSGIGTAVEIIRRVKAESSIKELVSDVECHLISFSHARRALLKTGTRDAQSELITPVMTFEAVRQARRLRVSDAEAAGFKVHDYELFDYAFQAPLSWTLSKRMRVQIEARSGGDVQPFLCCEVTIPFLFHFLDLPGLVLDVELSDDQIDKYPFLHRITPNERHYRLIIETIMALAAAEPNRIKIPTSLPDQISKASGPATQCRPGRPRATGRPSLLLQPGASKGQGRGYLRGEQTKRPGATLAHRLVMRCNSPTRDRCAAWERKDQSAADQFLLHVWPKKRRGRIFPVFCVSLLAPH